MKYVLIVGAKSDMAKAIAREYAKQGFNLYLAARNVNELEPISNDITTRFQRVVQCFELDLTDFDSHESFYNSLPEKPAGVITAVGYMGEQKNSEVDFEECHQVIDSNYTGNVCLLNIIANDFEARREGFIVGISSVAGDRGRKANYIYGSAKAAFTAYLSGLRNRLYDTGVQVLTVKPGFVATKMTENMDLPENLTAQPEQVAADVFSAQQKGKDILYTKWVWRYIMLIIKNIPEFIFKRLSI
ncbi:SDR family oxidoreductase [Aliikangiella sp. G2MR2-5]|uniref:SDR family oxidoreductase n=1 Tax=Aliikangiella sp. G2MR2-5 TaxID=2788943 RepID=UPI0018A9CD46|nr:SDR family oxidoreductase [Aliikangiella sp. G2MR2-5]